MSFIEREPLLAAYDAAHQGPPGGARKLIEEAPAVEVVPVIHGRWIDAGDFESCSICQGTHLKEIETYYGKATRLWIKTNYCPNCGAKMDFEETKHQSLPDDNQIVKKIKAITVTLGNDATQSCIRVYPNTGCVMAFTKECGVITTYTNKIDSVKWNDLYMAFELEEKSNETLQMP